MLRLVVAVKNTWWSAVDVLKAMIISNAGVGEICFIRRTLSRPGVPD